MGSALGQPFEVEIDLVAVEKEEKRSVAARLAPEDIFHKANVDYLPILSTFKTTIETRSDGRPYVRIVSPQPVAEPLLNMLVELTWPSGRLLREYTVLLGPPESDVGARAKPAAQPGGLVSAKAEPASGKVDLKKNREEETSIRESASVSGNLVVYVPVKEGDTLGRIARNVVSPPGTSFNQLLVALYRANRSAFFGDNIHQLRTGPILRIPDDSKIASIPAAEANHVVKAHTADWKRRRFFEDKKGAED